MTRHDRRVNSKRQLSAVWLLLGVFGLVFGLAVLVIGITVGPDYIVTKHTAGYTR